MRSQLPRFFHLSRLACGAALLLSCSSDGGTADDETSGDATGSTGPTTGGPTSTTTGSTTTDPTTTGSTTRGDSTGPGETTEGSDGTTDGSTTADTSDGTSSDGTTEDGTTESMATTGQSGLSYHQDAQPIYANYCSPCHAGQSAGGHNLATNYGDVFTASAVCNGLNKAECSIVRIQNGSMPPGGVCTGDPVQDAGNTSCLTAAEQQTIQDWIDDGMLP